MEGVQGVEPEQHEMRFLLIRCPSGLVDTLCALGILCAHSPARCPPGAAVGALPLFPSTPSVPSTHPGPTHRPAACQVLVHNELDLVLKHVLVRVCWQWWRRRQGCRWRVGAGGDVKRFERLGCWRHSSSSAGRASIRNPGAAAPPAHRIRPRPPPSALPTHPLWPFGPWRHSRWTPLRSAPPRTPPAAPTASRLSPPRPHRCTRTWERVGGRDCGVQCGQGCQCQQEPRPPLLLARQRTQAQGRRPIPAPQASGPAAHRYRCVSTSYFWLRPFSSSYPLGMWYPSSVSSSSAVQ